MALLYLSNQHKSELWIPHIQRLMPGLKIHVWPAIPDPAEITCALVWGPPPGELARYPNLKMVSSFGAGVEHLLIDGLVPEHLPICRIIDKQLTAGMTEYLLLHVLRQHRKLNLMQLHQAQVKWLWFDPADTPGTTVSILGLGVLGTHAAIAFRHLGFRVLGWSRTKKALDGVECYFGREGLAEILCQTHYLCLLLPHTRETREIINQQTLALLPQGAYVINAGRGALINEKDLLKSLDQGHLSGATLDVFETEPLLSDHPFWHHPQVTITPHNASDSIPASVAPQIVDNIRRAEQGLPLRNIVDRRLGY